MCILLTINLALFSGMPTLSSDFCLLFVGVTMRGTCKIACFETCAFLFVFCFVFGEVNMLWLCKIAWNIIAFGVCMACGGGLIHIWVCAKSAPSIYRFFCFWGG